MLGKNKINKISNNIKDGINYNVQLLVIAVLTVSLILLGWAYIVQESNKYKSSTIESYSLNQEVIVDQVAKTVKAGLAAASKSGYTTKQAEKAVLSSIIENAVSSGSKYWYFYSSDGVIYEKSEEETRLLTGKSISELVNYWKLKGGEGVELFEEMLMQGENGSAAFSKNSEIGNEIVTLKCFTVGDKEYYLGMSTLQPYVMNTARVNEHILYLWTFSALVSLDILIFSLLFGLSIYRNAKTSEKLNKSIVNKSLQIQELNRKLASKSEAVQNASIYDNLTKLYNRKFFDNLLARINHDLLLPVSIVILDINGLDQLNTAEGYSAGDELLEKTSDIMHRVCVDNDIVARTGSSEFTILMTGTKESEAYGTAENIRRQFSNLNNHDLTLALGVAQLKANGSSIFTVLEAARKNLILQKMLDVKSNTNSITSMLMAALNAYSREAVAHCDRLKEMAVGFGKEIGMSPSELSRLAVAAQLHDVGKIGIPDSILNKREALANHEQELIRRHSELGYNIVKAIPFLDDVAVDILQHHESYDGTGYPDRLRGEQISINARIVNIIDSFDAMTNASVYAKTRTMEEAIHELRKRSGSQYDPHLVNEFIKVITNNYLKDKEVEMWK